MSENMTTDAKKKPLGRILVVEDDKSISSMLQSVLSGENYDVTVAGDGLLASEIIAKGGLDLVLLDLHVPNRSGSDLLKDIRRTDQDSGGFVPVIILTGVYTSRNDKVVCLNAGADDFLPKPFDLIELLARVRSLMRIHELYKRSQFLATHDPLTRCYNRRYFGEFLDREFERVRRYTAKSSLLLLDLDKFKNINDGHGHAMGDQVLQHVGFRLQDFFRAVDCVARLGGDEFAAVLPDCSLEDARQAASRLLLYMNGPGMREGLPAPVAGMVSFSVGVATVPIHGENAAQLLRHADKALYAAKNGGRNQFRVWEEDRLAA